MITIVLFWLLGWALTRVLFTAPDVDNVPVWFVTLLDIALWPLILVTAIRNLAK